MRDHTDPWTVEYIEDLRRRTENNLIYAETCDLNSLHSVREFATKWINTTPPRRLDMIICNAGVLAPPFSSPRTTVDEIEQHWGINYLAHYHLVNLLSPAIRSQPPDRDVRILFTTCSLYAIGNPLNQIESSPWKATGTSKLALMMAAQDLQRQFDKYQRPDKSPSNIRCYCVDPGLVRTPMSRGFLSMGKIWGLLLYIVMWPIWFVVLKSTWEGAQSILHCAMSPIEYDKRGEDGWQTAEYCRDCHDAKYLFPCFRRTNGRYQREELFSADKCEELRKQTDKQIADAEKKSAIRRKVDEAKAEAEKKADKKADKKTDKKKK